MLFTLGIRKRSVCTGWIASDSNKSVKYYRRDITIPEYEDKIVFPEYLIEPSKIKSFLKNAYKKFMTSAFLILFSGLEAILLYYKKQNGLETTIKNSDFKKLKKKFSETCY